MDNVKNGISAKSLDCPVPSTEAMECIRHSEGLFKLLKIKGSDVALMICSDEEFVDDDIPKYDGCSRNEEDILFLDNTKARRMMECSIDKLKIYDGIAPKEVQDALINNYGGAQSKLFGNFIKFLLRWVRFSSVDAEYKCVREVVTNPSPVECGPATSAWSFPAIQFTDVRICSGNYFASSDLDRAGTLVHEWFHLYYVAGDPAYQWDPRYEDLSTLRQLLNADSFSQLVKDLCGECIITGKGAACDDADDCTTNDIYDDNCYCVGTAITNCD